MGRKRQKTSPTVEPTSPAERVAQTEQPRDDLPFDPIEPLPNSPANDPEPIPVTPAGDDVEQMAWGELLEAIKAEKDTDTEVDFLPREALKQGGSP